jgi:hypothetical protein
VGSLLKEYSSSLCLQLGLTIHIYDPWLTRFLKELKVFPELEVLVFWASFQLRISEEVREIAWQDVKISFELFISEFKSEINFKFCIAFSPMM